MAQSSCRAHSTVLTREYVDIRWIRGLTLSIVVAMMVATVFPLFAAFVCFGLFFPRYSWLLHHDGGYDGECDVLVNEEHCG